MATTLYKGGAVMGEHALCEAAYSARCFMFLCELSVPFPTNAFGEYAGYKTDHDPKSRATSAGPLTSKFMTEALERAAKERGIKILDRRLATRVLTENRAVAGLLYYDIKRGRFGTLGCENVILATGGPASLYEHSVYPKSQHGATSLAILAGATLSNMNEWQYGLASTDFRWNVSGSYQQVLPRYISVDEDGGEHEFLFDALGSRALDLVFLKGYQWPFDTRKLDGSSAVDLLVADEIKMGRRVYMDFTKNPKGLENGFSSLSSEAYTYLSKSDVLFGTPIERLMKMNPAAASLYSSHGIDLQKEPLAIAVCAQHANGGVCVDENWESKVKGLYAVGEAAGTFGVYRPGGSALNATQVGALRAAEHIAGKKKRATKKPSCDIPAIKTGASNIREIEADIQHRMSLFSAFDRDSAEMEKLYHELCSLEKDFFSAVSVFSKKEIPSYLRLYDTVITARATLSAMLFSAKTDGTHGAAIVDRKEPQSEAEPKKTRILTEREASFSAEVSPLPDAPLWFEPLLKEKLQKEGKINR